MLSSFLQSTEQATTDVQEIPTKVLSHMKIFNFLVFHATPLEEELNPSILLQRILFQVKDSASEGKRSGEGRRFQISFYDIRNPIEVQLGLADLKALSIQSKAKLIVYASEQRLIHILNSAEQFGIDILNIPVILVDSGYNADLAKFLGWENLLVRNFASLSPLELQRLARQWMKSSPEKVDVWAVELQVREEGLIQRLVGQEYMEIQSKCLQDHFISHFSVGYHPKLSANYQVRKSKTWDNYNWLVRGIQKQKNFCCLGSQNMLESTGVVSVTFLDDKERQLQILKHFRNYEGSEQSELHSPKMSNTLKTNQTIVSLVLSNIDRFHGERLSAVNDCRPSDSKLQLLIYESSSAYRKVCSISGEIRLKFQCNPQPIHVQVGQTVYRLTGCQMVRVRLDNKLKMLINKDILEC